MKTNQRSAPMPFEVCIPGREPVAVRTREIAEQLAEKFSKKYSIECEVRERRRLREPRRVLLPRRLTLLSGATR